MTLFLKRSLIFKPYGIVAVNYLSVDGLSDIPSETKGTERGAWNVVRAVRDHLDTRHPGLSRMQDHQVMRAAIEGETWDAGVSAFAVP